MLYCRIWQLMTCSIVVHDNWLHVLLPDMTTDDMLDCQIWQLMTCSIARSDNWWHIILPDLTTDDMLFVRYDNWWHVLLPDLTTDDMSNCQIWQLMTCSIVRCGNWWHVLLSDMASDDMFYCHIWQLVVCAIAKYEMICMFCSHIWQVVVRSIAIYGNFWHVFLPYISCSCTNMTAYSTLYCYMTCFVAIYDMLFCYIWQVMACSILISTMGISRKLSCILYFCQTFILLRQNVLYNLFQYLL